MPVNLYCGSSFVTRSNKKLSALAITYIKQDPQRFDSPPSSATRKGESWEGARMKLYFKKIYLTVSICVCVCVTVGVCACVCFIPYSGSEKKNLPLCGNRHILRYAQITRTHTHKHPLTPSHIQYERAADKHTQFSAANKHSIYQFVGRQNNLFID